MLHNIHGRKRHPDKTMGAFPFSNTFKAQDSVETHVSNKAGSTRDQIQRLENSWKTVQTDPSAPRSIGSDAKQSPKKVWRRSRHPGC